MTDDADLLAAFEAARLPEDCFRHRDHVRVAWLYLRRLPPAAALARFSEGLRRFAAAIGKAGLYHETITWAYLLLIHERMERTGASASASASFDEFAAANADLMTWQPSILDRFYSRETLASEVARRAFVFPDRLGPLAVAERPTNEGGNVGVSFLSRRSVDAAGSSGGPT